MGRYIIALLFLSGVLFPGCEVIEGIFKAGFWVGVIIVVIILLIIFFIARLFRG
jgi:hypothetical protein